MSVEGSIAPGRVAVRFRTRLSSFVAAVVIGVTVALNGAVPANANPVIILMESVRGLYALSKEYADLQYNRDSLQRATEKAIAAINAAKAEIIQHSDRLAAADVRTCVDSAVVNVADLANFTEDARRVFATNATECVTRASSLLQVVTTTAQYDELGFALNTVGPIALLARASSGLGTTALRDALVNANNALTARMTASTSCGAQRLDGDSPPGGVISYRLTCTAHNGETGSTIVDCGCGRPPVFPYTKARDIALRSTSHAVAKAVMPVLAA